MARLAAVAGLAVALAGCGTTATQAVDRSAPASVAAAHRALAGRDAALRLASGETPRGRIRSVQLDSVRWTDAALLRAAPTASVYEITIDNRAAATRRSALVGLGVGASVALALTLSSSDSALDEALGVNFSAAYGLLLGAGAGASRGRRLEYVFVGEGPR